MPKSEEAASMDLKETELTLGLPGVKLSSKRGFSDILDLNLVGTCWNGIREEVHNDDNLNDNLSQSNAPKPPPPKAQLVGWPPVRASRKNAMMKGMRSKYVKVAVDGAPYLRKVDLESYDSYQRLSEALEDMFSCNTIRNFFNDGKLIVNPINGSEYVPVYEDKDGDWMMIGDVPWKMFVESCKRIRLMKSSEAIELEPGGPGTPSKVEQGN